MVVKATYYVISDVHINLRKHPVWEKNRFTLLIDHLNTLTPATVVFNGDLFDRARPSLEEQQLVLSALSRLSKIHKVYVLAGNHEVVSKEFSTFSFLPKTDFTVHKVHKETVGNTTVNFVDWLNLDAIPKLDKGGVLISHFRSNLGIIQEEVDTKRISNKFDLVLLGDIHDRYSPHSNMHYTNSPYSIHFTTMVDRFGFIELNVSDGNTAYKYHTLNLPQKRKIVVYDVTKIPTIVKKYKEDMLKLVVTGSLEELSELPNYRNVKYEQVLVWNKDDVTVPDTTTDYVDILDPLESLVEAVTGKCDGALSKHIAELKGSI